MGLSLLFHGTGEKGEGWGMSLRPFSVRPFYESCAPPEGNLRNHRRWADGALRAINSVADRNHLQVGGRRCAPYPA